MSEKLEGTLQWCIGNRRAVVYGASGARERQGQRTGLDFPLT